MFIITYLEFVYVCCVWIMYGRCHVHKNVYMCIMYNRNIIDCVDYIGNE